MKPTKTFILTFILAFVLMLSAFGILYVSMDITPKETEKNQQGIAIKQPGIDDSKTILLCVGEEDEVFFFLIKLNAIQNKISIMSISPSYTLPNVGRTLVESMEKAGILQCSYDLKKEFDIAIDYYLHCSWTSLSSLLSDFSDLSLEGLGDNLPQSIRQFLLKGAENADADSLINAARSASKFLDNSVGLAFLNESAYILLKSNLDKLPACAEKIKDNYSSLNTSINSLSLEKLNRINGFLTEGDPEFLREIIEADEPSAKEKVDLLFKE